MNHKDLFIKNIHILRELMFFRRDDLSNINEEVFNNWIKNKYIVNQFEDIYSLNEEHIELTELTNIFLAEKYDETSYLSLQSALIDYGVFLATITVETFGTKNKKQFIEMNGRSNFYYMSSIPDSEEYILEKDVSLGNKAVGLKSTTKYKIATLELALIDFFYNKNKVLDSDDFDDCGLFLETLSVITNREKLIKIANKTKNENTIKTTENFIKWIN